MCFLEKQVHSNGLCSRRVPADYLRVSVGSWERGVRERERERARSEACNASTRLQHTKDLARLCNIYTRMQSSRLQCIPCVCLYRHKQPVHSICIKESLVCSCANASFGLFERTVWDLKKLPKRIPLCRVKIASFASVFYTSLLKAMRCVHTWLLSSSFTSSLVSSSTRYPCAHTLLLFSLSFSPPLSVTPLTCLANVTRERKEVSRNGKQVASSDIQDERRKKPKINWGSCQQSLSNKQTAMVSVLLITSASVLRNILRRQSSYRVS